MLVETLVPEVEVLIITGVQSSVHNLQELLVVLGLMLLGIVAMVGF